jgi:hypothetical protein
LSRSGPATPVITPKRRINSGTPAGLLSALRILLCNAGAFFAAFSDPSGLAAKNRAIRGSAPLHSVRRTCARRTERAPPIPCADQNGAGRRFGLSEFSRSENSKNCGTASRSVNAPKLNKCGQALAWPVRGAVRAAIGRILTNSAAHGVPDSPDGFKSDLFEISAQ